MKKLVIFIVFLAGICFFAQDCPCFSLFCAFITGKSIFELLRAKQSLPIRSFGLFYIFTGVSCILWIWSRIEGVFLIQALFACVLGANLCKGEGLSFQKPKTTILKIIGGIIFSVVFLIGVIFLASSEKQLTMETILMIVSIGSFFSLLTQTGASAEVFFVKKGFCLSGLFFSAILLAGNLYFLYGF